MRCYSEINWVFQENQKITHRINIINIKLHNNMYNIIITKYETEIFKIVNNLIKYNLFRLHIHHNQYR